MAIITEVPDSPKPPKPRTRKPIKPTSTPTPTPTPTPPNTSTTTNPFHFWFYFTILVSIITFFFISISYLTPQDPKAWFLNLPSNLRQHYSKGRTIKVQIATNQPQVEIFAIQEGSVKSADHVLFVHGLGCSSFGFSNVVKILGQKGVHAVGIDLPGSGFSDKSVVVVEESVVSGNGGVGSVWEMFSEIREKGLFWGFDQLIEQGYVNYEEGSKIRVTKREVVKVIELGSEEMGKVLEQVIDAMGVAPVDLVLHDSALALSANWISKNPSLVRSVVVFDSFPSGTALPLWVLGIPVVREVVLGSRLVFERVLGSCCLKSVDKSEAEAHRILLKGKDARRAVVEMGKKLNSSFDLAEWSGLDGVKGLPMQVIWSSGKSEEWSEKGRRIADALSPATFVTHSGGLWPQEHNAEEVAEIVYQFVSSLPKSSKQVEEEPIPEHIKKMLDETKSNGHDHHHHHEHHDDHHQHVHGGHDHHAHAHGGYADAYGLGNGWAM